VVLWNPLVQSPSYVRYGWADCPVCNLYNKEGLPACPFRTDDFEQVHPQPVPAQPGVKK